MFNRENIKDGKDIYYDFMNRHEDLLLRTADFTSLKRAPSTNKELVDRFYFNLTELKEKYNLTGVTCVLNNNKNSKKCQSEAKKTSRQASIFRKGRNVTAINALGDLFIPSLFVFPKVSLDND